MRAPVGVTCNGHRTLFKWHRARRRAADPVFTGRRILEGMAAGASVEVDLVVHAGGGMAVLHEPALGIETTGSGRVRGMPPDLLRALHLRGNDGQPIADRVMLIEDLCGLLIAGEMHREALLQLDYKEDAAALDGPTLAAFAASVEAIARHLIVSSGDAEAVALLRAAAPGIRVGYDPCHGEALARVLATRDFPGFVAEAAAASPDAEMIYLDHRLVLMAAEAGCDIVGAFHATGRRIDAYTIASAEPGDLAIARRLLALGVDQITTDDAEGLVAALGDGP